PSGLGTLESYGLRRLKAMQANQGTLRPSWGTTNQLFEYYPMWRQPRVARRAKRGGEGRNRTHLDK
ncbi:MAG: hypothetical protein AAGB46_18795, partial [Verrucomicrobiota bacterium]